MNRVCQFSPPSLAQRLSRTIRMKSKISHQDLGVHVSTFIDSMTALTPSVALVTPVPAPEAFFIFDGFALKGTVELFESVVHLAVADLSSRKRDTVARKISSTKTDAEAIETIIVTGEFRSSIMF